MITKENFICIILIFIPLFINISCNTSTSCNCKDFREGEFEMFVADSIKVNIKRQYSYQIETTSFGISKQKIHWTDSCSYELEFLETTTESLKQFTGKKLKVNRHYTE